MESQTGEGMDRKEVHFAPLARTPASAHVFWHFYKQTEVGPNPRAKLRMLEQNSWVWFLQLLPN